MNNNKIYEIRRDYILDRWVIFSSDRASRPHSYAYKTEEKKEFVCPFCPGNEGMTEPEILAYRNEDSEPNKPGWWLRVMPNKFPAVRREIPINSMSEEIYKKMGNTGKHEVIIDSHKHNASVATMSHWEFREVLTAYMQRIEALQKFPDVKYVFLFKNYGQECGASLSHPHSQIMTLPIVPKLIYSEIKNSSMLFDEYGKCIYCRIVELESHSERLISENKNFIAICPYASVWPYEFWIIPKLHMTSLSEVGYGKILDELTEIFQGTLRKLYKMFNDPPYNYALHFSIDSKDKNYYHMHFEIYPEFDYEPGGLEKGGDMFINPVTPEQAAKEMRGCKT